MKALSVKQPWASMIMGICPEPVFEAEWQDSPWPKNVENRTWCTDYRGPLVIHASKTFDDAAFDCFYVHAGNHKAVKSLDFPTGCLLGVVCLSCISLGQWPGNNWAQEGQYHWLLRDAKAFDAPIPYRGALGLWNVPAHILPEGES